MPDPIFDKSDTPGKKKLPAELTGKSPEEIMEYYERQHEIVMNRARDLVSRQTPPKKDPPVTHDEPEEKIDIFDNPTASINRIVERKVNEASANVSKLINPNLMNTCRMLMRERHKDFDRWKDEIEEAMKKMAPQLQIDPEIWEVAYTNIRGRHIDELTSEAVENYRKPKNPVETPTPGGTPAPKKEALSDMEKVVAGKYEMTEDQYRGYQDRYSETGGEMPFTYDSRKPKTKRKAS